MPDDRRAGVPVHWRTFGKGPENALFLHCALGRSGLWKGVAAELDDRLTITAPDMPSHGQSAAWDGETDFHDLVTDIAESFLEPGMHLVGHSFGATVALRLAETHGSAVRSVTLIEPVIFAAARESAADLYAANLRGYEPMEEAAAAGDWHEAARLFTGWWGAGPLGWDALSKTQRDTMARQTKIVLATGPALQEDANGILAAGKLEAVKAPVLLIRGALTEPIVPAIHEALHERMHVARDVVIDDASHMLPVTHPREVAAAIGAFVETGCGAL